MLTLFITIAIVHILALMSPGPDFFFISHVAASRGRAEATKGAFGVTLAVAIWTTFALLGLDLVLQKMVWVHQAIVIGGGLYLLWLGLQLLRSAWRQHRHPTAVAELTAPSLGERQRSNSFIRGLLTNLSNPKSIIYFGSIFSLFIAPDVTNGVRCALFLLIVLETFLWFTLVILLFSNSKVRLKYQQLSKWIEGCAGTLFMGFGVHLLLSRLR
jgi:threonine efflux protein